MSSFNRYFKMFILFVVLPLGTGLLLPVPVSAPHMGPSTPPCRTGSLALFYRNNNAEGVRCVGPRGRTSWNETAVTPPQKGVYEICSYSSGTALVEDFQANSSAQGQISVYVQQAPQCIQVGTLRFEPGEMMVTTIIFYPFSGGGGGAGQTPPNTLHQQECGSGTFTVWYGGGRKTACFAGVGILELPRSLPEVTDICQGSTYEGYVQFSPTRSLSYLAISLSSLHENCMEPKQILPDVMSITVNEVVIDPPR